MKNLFLDTNVVIDFLADRKPFSDSAAQIFNMGQSRKLKLFISAVSYNTIYYILRQSQSEKSTIYLLKELSALAAIADVTQDVIRKALQAEFKDFEDAIQYYTAASIPKIHCVVTRDPKGFKQSALPVMSPLEVLQLIQEV